MSELSVPPDGDADAVPALPHADDVATATLARVRDVTSELVRLVRSAAAQAADGWSLLSVVRPLVPELDRVFEDRDQLDREIQALRADVADADERTRELETGLAAREAGWKAERSAFETDVTREQERAQVLGAELAHERAEVERLAARERRLREQMAAVAARAQADREETLRLARDMVQSAEEARFAVVEELDQLRAVLAAEQASLVAIEHERVQATQGAAEREAELGRARQMIEQLESSRTAASAELARARARIVDTERDLLAGQHEYQVAQVQIEKLCAAHDDLVEDRAQLVARLHEAKEREARLRLRITGLEQRIQAARGGTPSSEEPPAVEPTVDADTSRLALELSRAEERVRVLEQDLATAKAAASAATLRVEALQEQARTSNQTRLAADAQLNALRTTVEALQRAAASEEALHSVPSAPVDVAPAPDEVTGVEPPECASSDPEPTPIVELEPMVAAVDDAVAPVAGRVAILDASDAWPSDGDVEACSLSPDETAVARLGALDATCCLVNLAAPGVIEAVTALRAANVATPFWACATDGDAEHALVLGPLDVVARPVDPESVRARLQACAPSSANVIMVGSESGTLMPLRQGVQLAGMSVRTAWNRAQAAEVADSVHPDVVIVDLASDATECAALLCDLARRERAPRIVLVAGTPAQHDALRAALATLARDGATLDRAALVRAALA